MNLIPKCLSLLAVALIGHVTLAVAGETSLGATPATPVTSSVPACVVSASETTPNVGATIVLTATCTATSVSSGPVTHTVVASNAAGASTPASIDVTWTADDWAKRSQGRLLARSLTSPDANDANMAGRHPSATVGVWYPGPTYNLPVIDQYGLRFDVMTGKGIPDWYASFNHSFGANSTMYVQWKQRFNQAFIDTVFQTADGGYPGVKLAVSSSFANTSDWQKLVVSTLDQWQFPFLYQYDQNGATLNLDSGVNNGANFDWRPKYG